MGIAGLVLGIISVVIAVFIPSVGWLGMIVGIIGIILSAMAVKQESKGINTAGLVLSIIGVALSLVLWIACALVVGCAGIASSVL